jgi:hypothetical protein
LSVSANLFCIYLRHTVKDLSPSCFEPSSIILEPSCGKHHYRNLLVLTHSK